MTDESKTPTALEAAQTEKAKAETVAAVNLGRRIDLEAKEIEHERELRGASEWEHHIYHFEGVVNEGSVQECVRIMGLWVRRNPKEPIEITFNSPGGGLFEGLALYDFIHQLRDSGTPVNTKALGRVWSMGGILLQAGETRKMSPHSYLMIHEVTSGYSGRTQDMEEDLKLTKQLQKRGLDILAERSTMSTTEIQRKWKKSDWWLNADEALKLGFCDAVE